MTFSADMRYRLLLMWAILLVAVSCFLQGYYQGRRSALLQVIEERTSQHGLPTACMIYYVDKDGKESDGKACQK